MDMLSRLSRFSLLILCQTLFIANGFGSDADTGSNPATQFHFEKQHTIIGVSLHPIIAKSFQHCLNACIQEPSCQGVSSYQFDSQLFCKPFSRIDGVFVHPSDNSAIKLNTEFTDDTKSPGFAQDIKALPDYSQSKSKIDKPQRLKVVIDTDKSISLFEIKMRTALDGRLLKEIEVIEHLQCFKSCRKNLQCKGFNAIQLNSDKVRCQLFSAIHSINTNAETDAGVRKNP